MCGRYSNEAEFSQIRLAFSAADQSFRPWRPTFNISPAPSAGYEQPFVVLDSVGHRQLKLGRWWFIPHWWSKPVSKLPTTFNARAEDVGQKPMFKKAFQKSRCLVPATGWREFVGKRSPKQPYHFHLGGELFAFAGLCSRWVSPEGEVVDSFTIMTTQPSSRAAAIHGRMPLVMPADSYDAWLAKNEPPEPVLQDARQRALRLPLEIFASDPRGNNTRFEGPEVVQPKPSSEPS